MLSPGTASPQRPASAARRPLTAGGSASAEPAAEDEAQGLSEEFLQQHCGVEDLSEVNRIDLCVNSLTHNVEVLGSMLPNLLHLKLSGSSISYLRELGTGLRRLEVLWLSCCGLQDISGIAGTMPELRELFLPFNDISDLSPLSAHEVLEVLDLEGNAVHDLDEVASLWMCTELRDLTLRCNPVCEAESFSRSAVLELLPQLAVLDDEEGPTGVQDAALDFVSASAAAVEPLQTAHLGLAAALAEAAELPAVQSFSEEPSELALLLERLKEAPPGSQAFSSWLRPLDRQSPSHAADASGCDSGKFRFENSMNLQGSCESSSTLTCGSLLSGNAVHAARQRRRHAPAASREGELDIRSLLRRHRAEGGVGASPASARGHEAATPSSAADAPAERPQTALAMEELRQRAPRAPPRGSARRSLSGPAGAGGAGDCGRGAAAAGDAAQAAPAPARGLAPLEQPAAAAAAAQGPAVAAAPPSAPRQPGQGRPLRRQSKAVICSSRHDDPVSSAPSVVPLAPGEQASRPCASSAARTPGGCGEAAPRARRRPPHARRSHSHGAVPAAAPAGDQHPDDALGLAARSDDGRTFGELLTGFALDSCSSALGAAHPTGKRRPQRPGDAFFLERAAGGVRYLLSC